MAVKGFRSGDVFHELQLTMQMVSSSINTAGLCHTYILNHTYIMGGTVALHHYGWEFESQFCVCGVSCTLSHGFPPP